MTTLMGLKHRVGAWGACTPLNPSGRESGLGGLAVVEGPSRVALFFFCCVSKGRITAGRTRITELATRD